MTTALVTGASVGIGAAFCRELARTGHDLVIVSRTRADLDRLAESLRSTYGVRVDVLPADLTDRGQIEMVAERLRDHDQPVDLLVNNAGFGAKGALLDRPVEEEERGLDVMCRAVLVLSHAACQAMRARGTGAVVNVSSVAGFAAMGHYSAIKAYVTSLSQGLDTELAGTGVRVMALCPGFTRTEFHQRAEMTMGHLPKWAWLDADALVREALADLAKGRAVSVPDLRYKALVGALGLLPGSVVRRVSRELSTRRFASSRRP